MLVADVSMHCVRCANQGMIMQACKVRQHLFTTAWDHSCWALQILTYCGLSICLHIQDTAKRWHDAIHDKTVYTQGDVVKEMMIRRRCNITDK